MTNVKVWTTIPESLHEEAKRIAAEYGYAEAECLRELIRRGIQDFRQLQRIRLARHVKRQPGSILEASLQLNTEQEIDLANLTKKFKDGWR